MLHSLLCAPGLCAPRLVYYKRIFSGKTFESKDYNKEMKLKLSSLHLNDIYLQMTLFQRRVNIFDVVCPLGVITKSTHLCLNRSVFRQCWIRQHQAAT